MIVFIMIIKIMIIKIHFNQDSADTWGSETLVRSPLPSRTNLKVPLTTGKQRNPSSRSNFPTLIAGVFSLEGDRKTFSSTADQPEWLSDEVEE
jgi:hypothetical protein